MDIIYWLIPLSIIILIIAVAIFFWAVSNGQYRDLDAAAAEILFENDLPRSSNSAKEPTKMIDSGSIAAPKNQSSQSQASQSQSGGRAEIIDDHER